MAAVASSRTLRVAAARHDPSTVRRPVRGALADRTLQRRLHAEQTSFQELLDGSTDLGRALIEAGRLIRRPSLIVILTDFLTPIGWQQPLSALAMRHEVIAAWVTDPREREIPDVGVVTFEDPETGQQILVDTGSAPLRARFEDALSAQRASIRADLVRARTAVAELTTAEEVVPQLVTFIKQREAQRGRGSRLVRCARRRAS